MHGEAGRSLKEPEFLVLRLLFFVWQVPHFWLLMAGHDADYRAAVNMQESEPGFWHRKSAKSKKSVWSPRTSPVLKGIR
jgi:hypothetical protein